MSDNNNKVWFITGAGRGMGLHIAKAALAAGYNVVATGRDPEKVYKAIGESENLYTVKLDITSQSDAVNAVKAAVEHFGKIDVLINNAANSYMGFFEELSPEQVQAQLNTNLVGPMNVTRAILPYMREARSGHVITISSMVGLVGFEYCSVYAAAKFGIEGWMESIAPELEPFGIETTIVEPGVFRTELLTENSTFWANGSINDYKVKNEQFKPMWSGFNGKQPGNPAKLAQALLKITALPEPPKRFLAGADVLKAAENKAALLIEQANAYRELSSSLGFED